MNSTSNLEETVTFSNLCQATTTVGEMQQVKAKVIPFAASNARGQLRQFASIDEIRTNARHEALFIKELLSTHA